jgi:hypothetical protein
MSEWTSVIYDEADENVLYLGGRTEYGPLLAKFSVQKMIYSWIFGLQIEDESAKTIWNLAETSQNDILVGLAEVSSD